MHTHNELIFELFFTANVRKKNRGSRNAQTTVKDLYRRVVCLLMHGLIVR